MHKPTKKDYYECLSVPKDATTEEIKKAYKKLAIRWHPDKNPGREKESEEKFKEIAEAYSVLSDPQKRKKYDTYGSADYDTGMGRGPSSNFGFEDFGFDMGGHRGNGFGNAFGGSFSGFSFERAEEIFREAFGDDFGFGGFSRKTKNPSGQHKKDFFDDDDFFMGGPKIGGLLKNFGFGGRDPFFDNDDFFGGGFGRMDKMMSGGIGSGMGGNMGGFRGPSKSVSTSTIIRNGKKVTVTKTTIVNADGTSHTEVHENIQDEGRTLKDHRYVDNNEFQRLEYNKANSFNDKRATGPMPTLKKGKSKF